MKTGLLWYDDDPRTALGAKVERAASRYYEKYGHMPTACFVSAGAVASTTVYNGVRVAPLRTVRAHYLWLGVDEP